MVDTSTETAAPTAAASPNRSASRISWLLAAVVVGLVVLTLLMNTMKWGINSTVKPPPPTLMTAKRLEHLQTLIQEYVDEHDRLPGETLDEALRTLAESGVDFSAPPRDAIAEGRDCWEAPLVYLHDDPQTLILRSIGGNGRHENGGGDDIQRVVNLRP
ncbi:hypothetical protein LOC68_13505 [Blastopirellula sp. JC732]|uniref:Type II secretion system protein GspG C-terminal domain-containing protein n=1 Tax=Blastopirellula sediminis TaxID=2894196 RepID=A0A9X1SFP0_9BACT|nr:hypothetical protein [Blastopirellula sediminis]MCC9607297.1 hypothetical protein [Blastopirellula sediminis]MCC9629410.1 hypothetical protein [Blastopirellula sediminis]